MKKKLLTILLSIFMSLGCFVNVVHADITTINDVLNVSNIPEMTGSSIPEGAWTNNNGGFLVIEEDDISFTNAEHTNCYTKSIYLGVTNNGNGTYEYTNDIIYVTFTISDNTLVNVIVSGLSDHFEPLNGTYTAPTAVKVTPYIKTNPAPNDIDLGDKLSDSTLFGGYVQVSSTDSTQIAGLFEWTNPNTIPALADSNLTLYSVTFTPIDTINYTTVSCEVLITVNHATHNPILVNGQAPTETASGWKDYYECVCGNLYEDATGSVLIPNLATWKAEGGNGYIAPLTPAKTIAEILATNIDFPTSIANAWKGPSNSHVAYKIDTLLHIEQGLSPSAMIDVNKNVSKVSDSQYKYHDSTGNYDVLFNLNNNKLISIEFTCVSEPYSVLNGKYEAPKTIADILPEDFPTTKAAGWVKENGSNDNRIYIDGENLMIGSSQIPLNAVLTKDGDNYKYQASGPEYTFNMEPDILKSINVTIGMAPPSANGDYVPYKYEKEQTESKPQGYTGDLVFKTNGKYTDPSQVVVKVDGTKLNQNADYTVDQGSIIVTLLGNYIKNLAPKTYAISIGVKDGETELYSEITSEFTITAAPSPTPDPDSKPRYKIPNTGIDDTYSNNHSLLKLSSLSLLAIGTYLVVKKRKTMTN